MQSDLVVVVDPDLCLTHVELELGMRTLVALIEDGGETTLAALPYLDHHIAIANADSGLSLFGVDLNVKIAGVIETEGSTATDDPSSPASRKPKRAVFNGYLGKEGVAVVVGKNRRPLEINQGAGFVVIHNLSETALDLLELTLLVENDLANNAIGYVNRLAVTESHGRVVGCRAEDGLFVVVITCGDVGCLNEEAVCAGKTHKSRGRLCRHNLASLLVLHHRGGGTRAEKQHRAIIENDVEL